MSSSLGFVALNEKRREKEFLLINGPIQAHLPSHKRACNFRVPVKDKKPLWAKYHLFRLLILP